MINDGDKEEIRQAVIDMALVDWEIPRDELQSYANRVVWWLENKDHIEAAINEEES